MDNNKINIRILKWHSKVGLNWKCSFEYNQLKHDLFAIYMFKPFKK